MSALRPVNVLTEELLDYCRRGVNDISNLVFPNVVCRSEKNVIAGSSIYGAVSGVKTDVVGFLDCCRVVSEPYAFRWVKTRHLPSS